MKQSDKQRLRHEAERLERIAVDVEELSPAGKFQADKLRGTAKTLRALADPPASTNIHGSGTGDD